jgi:adenylyl cyclase-associated protein
MAAEIDVAMQDLARLANLMRRLEAATARLEDIASSTIELPQAVPNLQHNIVSPLSGLSTTSTTTGRPPPPTAPPTAPLPPPPPPPEPVPESIEDFDAFLKTTVDKYAKASGAIGGLVAEQAAKVVQGFHELRRFLLITTKAKKPDIMGADMSIVQDLLKPMSEANIAVNNIKDANRSSPLFNNLSAVAEGIMVLFWVTVDARPYKHVEESLGAAQFFGNRVVKEYKDK